MLVIGMGTGRCGTLSLTSVLNQQPNTKVTHEQPPLLPWDSPVRTSLIHERIRRMRSSRQERMIGDVASFYLPYVPDIVASEPDVRIVCLKRPREEVVQSFCQWLDKVHPLPTNHWARRPTEDWHHEPVWTRIFPKYDSIDRETGIRRYWNEYYATAEELVRQWPGNIRIFEMRESLNTARGLSELLSFVGIPSDQQVLALDTKTHRSEDAPKRKRSASKVSGRNDPRRCVILVPHQGQIVPQCEQALRELEKKGYAVRRVGGYAAIDQGRNQMATDALRAGFEETLWIDSDIGFDPVSVERLRSHGLPLCCGIYPKKGKREVACHVLPGTPKIVFGKDGGLIEVLSAGTGFLHVRREVYETIQQQLALPVCNEHFGSPMVPFFQPMVRQHADGHWYLAEDYSFSERARQCGVRILADTTIRLWHIGSYAYSWEEAGSDPKRFGTFTLNLWSQGRAED